MREALERLGDRMPTVGKSLAARLWWSVLTTVAVAGVGVALAILTADPWFRLPLAGLVLVYIAFVWTLGLAPRRAPAVLVVGGAILLLALAAVWIGVIALAD